MFLYYNFAVETLWYATMVEKTKGVLFLLCIFSCVSCGFGQTEFDFSGLKLTALQPQGLRVELPDRNGLKLLAFHGNLNSPLSQGAEGEISGEADPPTNGKWIFEDSEVRLKLGDTLNYRVYVQWNNFGYTKQDLSWKVTKFGRTESHCTASSTTVSGAEGDLCSGNLIFQDGFDQPNIDQNKWTIQKYIPFVTEDDHYEFVSYQNRDENRFIRSSILYLKPTPLRSRWEIYGKLDLSQGCTKEHCCIYQQVGGYVLPPVISAKIVSKMTFKYGKVEIRAKMPIGDWIYPQIELIPKNSPPYSKIVIAYTRGNVNLTLANGYDIGNTLLFGGPIQSTSEPERRKYLRSIRMPAPLGSNMRTYTLVWSPTRIEVMVDSDLFGTVFSSEYSGFNTELQIALGVGVGGHYDFPDDINSGGYLKPWRNLDVQPMLNFFDKQNIWSRTWHGDDVALQIDSVKVWAL